MSTNKKIISILTLLSLVVGIALLYMPKNEQPQKIQPTRNTQAPFPPAKKAIIQPPPPEPKTHVSDAKPQELSPEMHQAINNFVGKGKNDPKIEKLKEGGNISRLDGRYRHVTVVTIDNSGTKKIQEYGPHGVEEGK